ncbi:putative MFS peptide transporter [Aspergillus clavatus NRRL 1]|uniref:Oligopeptide transporter n=1 Tax=Aspergillus clavatus (strain ATCC 1007 / CBS 513.65 / DSM 816 / NCTC 3887 / NRRL 1 / QM 1276 / 107) TaxID=344612 RepID=A1C8G3_ASPCL|nr:oligopeptide transporter [Aspergillus clavatus NRRL 1]EAW13600.1 oligopeptide transporter [Aspergillus clavatus NRRL 1]
MNSSDPVEVAEAARSRAAAHDVEISEKQELDHKLALTPSIQEVSTTTKEATVSSVGGDRQYPSEEDFRTLRRVAGTIPWTAYTVAFVELCERFSYYGTTAVFVNFIQRPLPVGSTTGAGYDHSNPGALGMGQQASTGLTLFNSFWSYIMPLLGAFMADQYWGRFRTIMFSIAAALLGHLILIVSALPPVISNPNGAIGCFAVGLIIMGVGTGGFKSNISPLIAEQYREEHPYIRTLASGERVIVDPAATISRIYLYFYLMINIGSILGQVSMVYAEKYVGFWLSFFLPTIMYLGCPAVLFFCRNKYHLVEPTGSVYTQAFRLWKLAMEGRWSMNPARIFKKNDKPFWDSVKPSALGPNRPQWMTFDDEWVDEVGRGLKACKVFLWYPLFWLAYNQMLNNLTSQAATMKLGGVPNDIINNLNPLSLIIFIPIMDQLVYPGLRRLGFHFTPLKRITAGFYVAGASMICATVTQHYIYKLGPCGKEANFCLDQYNKHTDISVWVQALTYVLGGISEIFASVTSLEYAFTKAPTNMRSLVQAVALFMNAFSSALGQALVGLAEDPLLVWNYAIVAILAFIGGTGFWLTNYKLDKQEDELNNLPQSQFQGKVNPKLDEETAQM